MSFPIVMMMKRFVQEFPEWKSYIINSNQIKEYDWFIATWKQSIVISWLNNLIQDWKYLYAKSWNNLYKFNKVDLSVVTNISITWLYAINKDIIWDYIYLFTDYNPWGNNMKIEKRLKTDLSLVSKSTTKVFQDQYHLFEYDWKIYTWWHKFWAELACPIQIFNSDLTINTTINRSDWNSFFKYSFYDNWYYYVSYSVWPHTNMNNRIWKRDIVTNTEVASYSLWWDWNNFYITTILWDEDYIYCKKSNNTNIIKLLKSNLSVVWTYDSWITWWNLILKNEFIYNYNSSVIRKFNKNTMSFIEQLSISNTWFTI